MGSRHGDGWPVEGVLSEIPELQGAIQAAGHDEVALVAVAGGRDAYFEAARVFGFHELLVGEV